MPFSGINRDLHFEKTSEPLTFATMSTWLDNDAAISPGGEALLRKDRFTGEIFKTTVTTSDTLAVQVLNGREASNGGGYSNSGESFLDGNINAKGIEMTMIEKMVIKTTIIAEEVIEKDIEKNSISMKTALKRKLSSEKEACSQASLTRLPPPAPIFQNGLSIPTSNASRGRQQTRITGHSRPASLGHAVWKKYLTKVTKEPHRPTAPPTLDQALHDQIVRAPTSGAITSPITQGFDNEAFHIVLQTSILQGGQGPLFLPASSLASSTLSALSAPLTVSNADSYASNDTMEMAEEKEDHSSHEGSCNQDGDGTSFQPPLGPPALPFTAQPGLNLQSFEITHLAAAPITLQDGSYQSFPVFSIGPPALQTDPESFSVSQTTTMAQDGITVSTPTANTALSLPLVISPTRRSTRTSIPAPVSNNSALATPPSPRRTNARRPLPGLPVPVTAPSTPSLDSSPWFGDFLPRRKAKLAISLAPIEAPKPKPIQRYNPFVDLQRIDGNDTPEIYYKYNPIMLAFRQHQIDANPEYQKIGPYRKAAVWEFIGQTFEKGGRSTLKLKQRKRFRTYAAGAVPVPGTSCLAREVMTVEKEQEKDQHDSEANREWGKLMNGEGDW